MEDNKTPPAPTPGADDKGGKNGGQGGSDTPKTFTPEEHQAELDRIAAKTRAEEKEKADRAIDERIKKERAEWERLQKLSDDEKEKERAKKQQEEYDQRERDLTLKENKLEATTLFAEKKLPIKLVDTVLDVDKEKMKEKINTFENAFNEAVKAGIAEATKGGAPTDVNKGGSSQETVDSFQPNDSM